MNRRGFLSALLSAGAAPAIVRADSLMRIVPLEVEVLTLDQIRKSADWARRHAVPEHAWLEKARELAGVHSCRAAALANLAAYWARQIDEMVCNVAKGNLVLESDSEKLYRIATP